jgi:hypothetical protein
MVRASGFEPEIYLTEPAGAADVAAQYLANGRLDGFADNVGEVGNESHFSLYQYANAKDKELLTVLAAAISACISIDRKVTL